MRSALYAMVRFSDSIYERSKDFMSIEPRRSWMIQQLKLQSHLISLLHTCWGGTSLGKSSHATAHWLVHIHRQYSFPALPSAHMLSSPTRISNFPLTLLTLMLFRSLSPCLPTRPPMTFSTARSLPSSLILPTTPRASIVPWKFDG